MYKVYKQNRIATKTTFATYEAARQWVRSKLRDLTIDRHKGQPALPFALLGFSIRKVV